VRAGTAPARAVDDVAQGARADLGHAWIQRHAACPREIRLRARRRRTGEAAPRQGEGMEGFGSGGGGIVRPRQYEHRTIMAKQSGWDLRWAPLV
jgi:hypothetical protein